jgi:small subunit ribosomal protein S8
MHQDPISDMLTRVRNAIRVKHEKVDIPASKLKKEIVKIMKNEGFIKNFKLLIDRNGRSFIRIFLKYTEEGEPALTNLIRASKPSRRIYKGCKDIPRKLNGIAVTVLSTSSGVLTGKKAKEAGVGGEIICYLW